MLMLQGVLQNTFAALTFIIVTILPQPTPIVSSNPNFQVKCLESYQYVVKADINEISQQIVEPSLVLNTAGESAELKPIETPIITAQPASVQIYQQSII